MSDEDRLTALGRRLQLDAEHQRLSDALGQLPHVILKGPSTAALLGDSERTSADIDVLVPASRRAEAVELLIASGVVVEAAGALGEQGAHSQLLLGANGREIDLHVTLPMLLPDGDRPWVALAPHVVDLGWDLGPLPVLDEAGRCLVLALHAAGGSKAGRPYEELKGARAAVPDWTDARALAEEVGAAELFDAGISLVDPSVTAHSRTARLSRTGAPGAALRLAQIAELPLRDRPVQLWRELFPSQGFMRRHYRVDGGMPMINAYITRLFHQARQLRAALRAFRD